MGKVFAVTSGKGGVGKSTVSLGLSLAFCNQGKKVLLIDMDEGLRCLEVMLGIDEKVVFDLSDILAGKDFADGVYFSESLPLLHLIPAPATTGLIDSAALTALAHKVVEYYDIIIFDFPAGIDFSLYGCLPKDSLFLTVAFPDPVTIRDASVVSQKLEEMGLSSRLIINRFDFKLTKKKIFNNIDDIIDKSGLQLLGIIPNEAELTLLSVNHKLKKRGKAFAAFTRISERLLGNNIRLPKLKKI